MVADIRRFPGSRRFPHFKDDALKSILADHNIEYRHFEKLGGRRNPKPDSKNDAWRVAAFRGYADYMESDDFKTAVQSLEEEAKKKHVAYMCSEAVWWSCHRALVSDYLKWQGWEVYHILATNKDQLHPYTSPARVTAGQLSYRSDGELF